MLPRDIQNIRYAPYEGDDISKIEFDVFGIWYRIREPMDVLLVDGGDAAREWIYRRYATLILDETAAKRARNAYPGDTARILLSPATDTTGRAWSPGETVTPLAGGKSY